MKSKNEEASQEARERTYTCVTIIPKDSSDLMSVAVGAAPAMQVVMAWGGFRAIA